MCSVSFLIGITFFVVSGESYQQIVPGDAHINSSVEYRLKQTLLKGYDVTSRPVRVDSASVSARIGVSLFHILDTNERHQTISALLSIRVKWQDEYLKWNNSEYNITKFWIPAKSIWRPDLIITNYANDEYSDYMNTNAIVNSKGNVMWTFPIVVKMYCTLDVRYFPFDAQNCNMTFVSWTYDGFRLSLNHTGAKDQMVYYNPRNQEWMVTKITPVLEKAMYPCCPEPFYLVHFTIHMYRRCLFYVINLICPCLLIYFVSFLGFFLPIESGEKVNLEITVLLALVVFLLMVSEQMPPTPDAIPILGLLFSVTMVMVALAVVMAVTVTHVYFSQPDHVPPMYAIKLSNYYKRWHRRPNLEKRLRAHKGIARMRRVDVDAISMESLDVGGKTSTDNTMPPSASYFKHTLLAASSSNGHVPSMAWMGRCQQSNISPTSPLISNNNSNNLPTSQPVTTTTTNSNNERTDDSKAADMVAGATAASEKVDHTDEWQYAAFALDRIFFWIFFCLTCIMFVIVVYTASPAFSHTFYDIAISDGD